MWFFWIVGREMESLYGSRDFLAFYLGAAIFSTSAWVRLRPPSRAIPIPMIGASGAVMAVVTLYTLYYPRREILLIIIPMPMWVLLAIYLVFPLLPDSNGGTTQDRNRVAIWLGLDLDSSSSSSIYGGRGYSRARVPGRGSASSRPFLASSPGLLGHQTHQDLGKRWRFPEVGVCFRTCRKSSSTRGSTKFLPRSRAKAARH